ncbi:MAG: dihydroorotate dehydrogenase (quinone), partial [Bacteroidota bacterium]|nr:dihydroorotate dehydrogenase (quinone) [Bacteroidota bacterium]
MYSLLRRFLFFFPPEWVHNFSMNLLKTFCSISFVRRMIAVRLTTQDAQLITNFSGLTFKNPIGLGAGFDKNAKYLRELETLGFGFVEIGTVTPLPQPGNEKPRLFRLPKDKAFINHMGFNNDGVKVIGERLKSWKEKKMADGSWSLADTMNGHSRPTGSSPSVPTRTGGRASSAIHHRLIIGGNIGKNKITPNEDAWKDYEICFK